MARKVEMKNVAGYDKVKKFGGKMKKMFRKLLSRNLEARGLKSNQSEQLLSFCLKSREAVVTVQPSALPPSTLGI